MNRYNCIYDPVLRAKCMKYENNVRRFMLRKLLLKLGIKSASKNSIQMSFAGITTRLPGVY